MALPVCGFSLQQSGFWLEMNRMIPEPLPIYSKSFTMTG